MPKSTIAGHPLHPVLIAAPAALLPFACILDLMHRATGDERYREAAYFSLVGGLVGGAAAATAGIMDYLTIAPGTEVKRTANTHALLNTGAMALTAASVIGRRRGSENRGGSVLLSGLAAMGVVVSGWFGGKMVYEQGMRVQGISPVAGAPDASLPGSKAMLGALNAMEGLAPSGGPQTPQMASIPLRQDML